VLCGPKIRPGHPVEEINIFPCRESKHILLNRLVLASSLCCLRYTGSVDGCTFQILSHKLASVMGNARLTEVLVSYLKIQILSH
jgi:hypothetical protein